MPRLQRTAVAAAVFGLALAQGGYSARFLGAACAVVWWAVAAGALARRWDRASVPVPAALAIGSLAGLAIVSALSMGWASDGGAAFNAAVRSALYAGILALVVVASGRGGPRPWIDGLAIGIALAAALALGSRLESGLPGGDTEIARYLPSAAGRLSYPLGYWNALAALLAIGIVTLAHLAAEARSAIPRALAAAAIPMEALALYLTSSRGGVLAAAVGLAVLLAAGRARSRTLASGALSAVGAGILVLLASRRHALLDGLDHPGAGDQGTQILIATLAVTAAVGLARLALDRAIARIALPRGAGLALGAVAAALAVGALVAADPAERFDEFRAPPSGAQVGSDFVSSHFASGNGSGRWQYWSAAASAWEGEPLRGIGAGGYEAYWNQHGSLTTPARNAHSLFLETLAELGILGIAFPIAFFAIPAVTGVRRLGGESRRDVAAGLAVLAAGATSAAIDWTFQVPAAFAPVVLAAGLLAGGATRTGIPRRVAPRWSGAAAVAFGVTAIWAGALVFASQQRLADSQSAVRDHDLAAAARAAADAHALEPWSAASDLQQALVRERAGDLGGAWASIRDAIGEAPQDWRLRLVEARLDVKAGDVHGGRAALSEARRLNPNAPIFAAQGSAAG